MQAPYINLVQHHLQGRFITFLVCCSQSRYFQSMFGGPWRESTEEIIHIEIPDERIDLEGNKM